MKKLMKISILMGVLLSSTWSIAGSLATPPAVKSPTVHGTLEDKRCEKCKRGPDGKMICEPVACPK